MDRKAVVIGATGVVGREVVNELVERNEISEIITFTRREMDFGSPKVINYVIDFDNIEKYSDLISGEYFFSCLGTTKSQAGSIEKQRIVDVDYQFEFAKLAQTNGMHHYFLVSSPGADANSSNDYLKMKGELDEKVKELDFASISIFKPSLIVGKRDDFRLGEKVGIVASKLIDHVPGLKKYRSITGSEIAKKMVSVAMNVKNGKNTFELDELFKV
jgi:uncharacterized protein YbjT (DUF2867 family)